jgi:hypothetical protein
MLPDGSQRTYNPAELAAATLAQALLNHDECVVKR